MLVAPLAGGEEWRPVTCRRQTDHILTCGQKGMLDARRDGWLTWWHSARPAPRPTHTCADRPPQGLSARDALPRASRRGARNVLRARARARAPHAPSPPDSPSPSAEAVPPLAAATASSRACRLRARLFWLRAR
eukprot:1192146-Prymnesium_polylepis.1